MKTRPTINIQDEVAKIHAQYGMSEMANYQIEKLFEKHVEQFSPKVKQLEWREDYFDIIAYTLYGKYIVSKPVSGVAFILYLNNNVIDAFFNLDEAKAFAQADFEQRVKECLIIE